MTDDTKPADLPEPVGVIGTQVGGVHWTVWDGKNTHTAVSKDSTTAVMFKSLPLGTLLYAAPPAPQPADLPEPPPIWEQLVAIGKSAPPEAWAASTPQAPQPEPATDRRRDALRLAERCCDSIAEPGTWGIGDKRWRVDTDAGNFYGATLDEALADFWRSALQARDDDGNAIEPDPFAAPPAPQPEPALQRFTRLVGEREIQDPVERLRAFCSLAMRGQDWIDCEPFFDAIAAELARPAPQPAEPVAAFYQGAEHEPPYAQYARGVQEGYELGQRHALQDAANTPQPAGRALPSVKGNPNAVYIDKYGYVDVNHVRAIERAHGIKSEGE